MIRDKRRHEAPEDRRDYQDKLSKREARQDEWSWARKSDNSEDPLVSVASAINKVKEDLTRLSGMIVSTPSERSIITGGRFEYVLMDELNAKRVPPYIADTKWDGWKPEPEDLRGKKKKKWHSVQYKAYKKWNAEAEIREAVELEIVGEARTDLGWGGF